MNVLMERFVVLAQKQEVHNMADGGGGGGGGGGAHILSSALRSLKGDFFKDSKNT